MHRPLVSAIATLALVFVTSGCARQRFPDTPVEKITHFSLGSARFTPFKIRPTAKQLHDEMLRLYESFDTVAESSTIEGVRTHRWSVIDGKACEIKSDHWTWVSEFRAKKPDKTLSLMDGSDGLTVMVMNGKTEFIYSSRDNRYSSWPANKGEDASGLTDFGLRWNTETNILKATRLLRDDKVGGTPVYVLELDIPANPKWRAPGGGHAVPIRRRIYVGKSDLLPRKIVELNPRPLAERKIGLTDNRSTTTFSGIVINTELPDALFPAEPPRGARPYQHEK